MHLYNVLVASNGHDSLGDLSNSLKRIVPDADFHLIPELDESSEAVTSGTCDALLCRVETKTELQRIRRIRQRRPDLPIELVSAEEENPVRSMPLAGPTTWAPSARQSEAVAKHLAAILNLKKAGAALAAEVSRSRRIMDEMKDLREAGQEILQASRQLTLPKTKGPADGPVLFVTSDRLARDSFPDALRERQPGLEIETAGPVDEALSRLTAKPHRAVVHVVHTPDEIAGVVRVKKAWPDIPLVMLTTISDPVIFMLGEQMGADVVLHQRQNAGRNAEGLLHVLEALLARDRKFSTWTRPGVSDVRMTSRKTRDLITTAIAMAAAARGGEFLALIVENAPGDLLLVTRALNDVGLPSFYRAVESCEEAIEYLRGGRKYRDRTKFPFPSLIISDLTLPGRSGLDLLRDIRENPALRPVGFILYTSSERAEDQQQAALLGANFYVVKSARPDPLVAIVGAIFTRFVQERSGLES